MGTLNGSYLGENFGVECAPLTTARTFETVKSVIDGTVIGAQEAELLNEGRVLFLG